MPVLLLDSILSPPLWAFLPLGYTILLNISSISFSSSYESNCPRLFPIAFASYYARLMFVSLLFIVKLIEFLIMLTFASSILRNLFLISTELHSLNFNFEVLSTNYCLVRSLRLLLSFLELSMLWLAANSEKKNSLLIIPANSLSWLFVDSIRSICTRSSSSKMALSSASKGFSLLDCSMILAIRRVGMTISHSSLLTSYSLLGFIDFLIYCSWPTTNSYNIPSLVFSSASQ